MCRDLIEMQTEKTTSLQIIFGIHAFQIAGCQQFNKKRRQTTKEIPFQSYSTQSKHWAPNLFPTIIEQIISSAKKNI